MARQFEIPIFYKSPVISRVKKARQMQDPRKRDLLPTVLDFGPVRFILARHFGFCFGVENAVEIAYKTLQAHADRRVFFLSEMIHNPNVNWDLQDRGVALNGLEERATALRQEAWRAMRAPGTRAKDLAPARRRATTVIRWRP